MQMIDQKFSELSLRSQFDLLGLNRSSYYPKNGTSLPSSNLISQNISTISQISNLKLPQFFSPEA